MFYNHAQFGDHIKTCDLSLKTHHMHRKALKHKQYKLFRKNFSSETQYSANLFVYEKEVTPAH